MPYRLAAIDLDQTLLDSRNRVGEADARALRALAEAGVIIAAATARWNAAARWPLEQLGIDAATIACGGADVRLGDGAIVEQTPLPPEFVPFVAALCDRAGWVVSLSTPGVTYRRERELPAWAANAPAGLVPVTHLREADLTGLLTVLAHVDEGDPHLAELAPWAGRVRVHNAVAFDGSGMITVTAAGIDKGTALVALCGALGLDPAEAVAFGDSEVDIPMFEAAGLAVAMGNATAPVRAAAAMVTATADEGGVAQAIRRIWGC